MMAGRLREDPRPVKYPAPFWILCSESYRLDSRVRSGGSTHRARLQRHPERTAVEPRLTQSFSRRTYRHDFGVGGWIERSPHRVSSFSNDLASQTHDRADRHFPGSGRFGGKVERPAHGRRQRKVHVGIDQPALLTAFACCVGGTTFTTGTATLLRFVPTATEPVSISNVGV